MRKQLIVRAAFVAALLIGSIRTAHASTISINAIDAIVGGTQTNSDSVSAWQSTTGAAPVDAANDLLKNHILASSPTLTGGLDFGTALAPINDGLMVSNGGTCSIAGLANMTAFTEGTALVFKLDAKYKINRIDSFTMWTADRIGQKYDLYTSTDGGTTWTTAALASVNVAGVIDYDPAVYMLRGVSVTDSTGVLASGVNALKFQFSDASPGRPIYADIAAYGTAIPEPSTMVMAALGLIGLICYAWRKRT